MLARDGCVAVHRRILLVEEFLDGDGDVNAGRVAKDSISDVIAKIFLVDDVESSCCKYVIELV